MSNIFHALLLSLMTAVSAPALLQIGVANAQDESPANPVDASVAHLQSRWAEIKYQMSDKKEQLNAIAELEVEAAASAQQYPQSAGMKIWQAIILSTDAGFEGGLSALGKVKEAKALLEAAEKIDATALNGSVYTSLGSLYYQVPGWPVGFGDDKQAARYLQKALAVNPDGVDPNYFYGDFLVHKGKYKDAIPVLEKALTAPARPNREVADAGRRQEVTAALAIARKKAGLKAS